MSKKLLSRPKRNFFFEMSYGGWSFLLYLQNTISLPFSVTKLSPFPLYFLPTPSRERDLHHGKSQIKSNHHFSNNHWGLLFISNNHVQSYVSSHKPQIFKKKYTTINKRVKCNKKIPFFPGPFPSPSWTELLFVKIKPHPVPMFSRHVRRFLNCLIF